MKGVGGIRQENSIEARKFNGIYAEIADCFGDDITQKVYSFFKGQQVNFPIRLYDRAYITMQIQSDYNGKNIKQLVIKYGYCEKTIRRMIKEKTDNLKQ